MIVVRVRYESMRRSDPVWGHAVSCSESPRRRTDWIFHLYSCCLGFWIRDTFRLVLGTHMPSVPNDYFIINCFIFFFFIFFEFLIFTSTLSATTTTITIFPLYRILILHVWFTIHLYIINLTFFSHQPTCIANGNNDEFPGYWIHKLKYK